MMKPFLDETAAGRSKRKYSVIRPIISTISFGHSADGGPAFRCIFCEGCSSYTPAFPTHESRNPISPGKVTDQRIKSQDYQARRFNLIFSGAAALTFYLPFANSA